MEIYKSHHILMQVAGHHQEVVRLLPPFVISDSHIDQIVTAVEVALEKCKAFQGPICSVGKQLASAAAKQKIRSHFQSNTRQY
jgi:ornithine--oxo-acid transaminase